MTKFVLREDGRFKHDFDLESGSGDVADLSLAWPCDAHISVGMGGIVVIEVENNKRGRDFRRLVTESRQIMGETKSFLEDVKSNLAPRIDHRTWLRRFFDRVMGR